MAIFAFLIGCFLSAGLVVVGFGRGYEPSPGELSLSLYAVLATGTICAALVKIWQYSQEAKVLQPGAEEAGQLRKFLHVFGNSQDIQAWVGGVLVKRADAVNEAVQNVINLQQKGLPRAENETDEAFQDRYQKCKEALEAWVKDTMDMFYRDYDIASGVRREATDFGTCGTLSFNLRERSWKHYRSRIPEIRSAK